MLSNISHDLKTPLTVILGYSEMLMLSDFSEMSTIRKIYERTAEVINLINKFFTLSKIESGDMQLTIGKINLSELCRKVAIDFYQILTEKEFTVDIRIPEQNIIVSGNDDAISRILNNLISNAIRYGCQTVCSNINFNVICIWKKLKINIKRNIITIFRYNYNIVITCFY